MITRVETVVFRLHQQQLEVLLIADKTAQQWHLPSDAVDEQHDRHLHDTVERILAQYAGLTPAYVEQVTTVGQQCGPEREWAMRVLHLCLLPFSCSEPLMAQSGWLPLNQVSASAIPVEQQHLIHTAYQRLRNKAQYSTLPLYLMEHELTLPELQRAWEMLLENPMHKRAFRERMLSANVLHDTGKRLQRRGSPTVIYRHQLTSGVTLFDRLMKGHTHSSD